MIGMMQIVIYMLSIYMVLKGVEILQIGLASARPLRTGLIQLGAWVLAACVVLALGFIFLANAQATSASPGIS